LTALLLIAVFGLVLINAFFVIAEYSLVRSRRPKLEAAKEEGLRGAALALEQLDNINEYISACQVGITLTSIGIGAVGEPVVAGVLGGGRRSLLTARTVMRKGLLSPWTGSVSTRKVSRNSFVLPFRPERWSTE